MRHNRWLQALIVLLVLIAAVYLLELVWNLGQRFAGVLMLFFLAWTVAFALTPLIEMLSRARAPRFLAVSLLYMVIALLVVMFIVLVVPAIAQQISLFASSIPSSSIAITEAVARVHSDLVSRGLSDEFLLPAAKSAVDKVDGMSTAAVANSLALPVKLAAGLVDGILVLVLSFYMALDGPKIVRKLLSMVPPRYRHPAELFVESVAGSFGGFIRTQLLLALLAAVVTGAVMRIFGVGYALSVAVVCGAVMLVPMIGNIVALVPPTVVALLLAPNRWTALWVFLVLWATQQVMLNFIAPRLLGQSVGLHPLLVFFAMLLGASAAGAWGAIFGVPILAVVVMMARHFYRYVLVSTPLFTSPSTFHPGERGDAPGDQESRPSPGVTIGGEVRIPVGAERH